VSIKLYLLAGSDVKIASHFVDLKGAMNSTSIKGFVFCFFILPTWYKKPTKLLSMLLIKIMTYCNMGIMSSNSFAKFKIFVHFKCRTVTPTASYKKK